MRIIPQQFQALQRTVHGTERPRSLIYIDGRALKFTFLIAFTRIMEISTVAVAGGTGLVGLPLVTQLIAEKFNVVVLVRIGSQNVHKLPASPSLQIREVDYHSVKSLQQAMKSVDAVVSTLTTAFVGQQNSLIDAAAAAGVKRFIPSEFGCNTLNAHAQILPVFAPKVQTQKYLQQWAKPQKSFTYTVLLNGPFLDRGLTGYILDLKHRQCTLYDSGNRPFSTTTLSYVVAAMVAILRQPERTANRAIFISNALVTQLGLLEIAKEKDNGPWKIEHVSTDDLVTESHAELKKEDPNHFKAAVGFIRKAMFGEGYGANFEDETENQLSGIPKMTQDDIRTLVLSLM